MRAVWLLIGLAACSDSPTAWLEDAHILVDGYDETNMDCRMGLCGHDENTDLVVWSGATYLVHRTAESQILGPNSSLRVSRSDDQGATWRLLAVIPAPLDRDLRDPHFYVVGTQLAIKAITRIPHSSTRDADVRSISVNTVTTDDGHTWTPLTAIGPETWSFWRIRDDAAGVHYSAAYEDGDMSVKLFSSTDGQTWIPGAVIYAVAADTPLETELIFSPTGLTALVRMDGADNELLGSEGRLRTKVCTAQPPYASFDCSRELTGVRLDGPVAFSDGDRTFVIARKHLLEVANRKRTALYELTTDGVVERGVFPSAGDTSYAGVAVIGDHRWLVSYYSSNVHQDSPWARAMFGPTDIWQASIDLSKL